jgi:hypothetical protein
VEPPPLKRCGPTAWAASDSQALQITPADDTRALHREIRHNLALLKALNLERRDGAAATRHGSRPGPVAGNVPVLLGGWSAIARELLPDQSSAKDFAETERAAPGNGRQGRQMHSLTLSADGFPPAGQQPGPRVG